MRKSGLTSELVCRLIAEQFPQWAHLPVRPADIDGWDNASFRLGEDMTVRLPSDEAYVGRQAERGHRLRNERNRRPGLRYRDGVDVRLALRDDPADAAYTRKVIEEILADHERS